MDHVPPSFDAPHHAPLGRGLTAGGSARRWPVSLVLLVALALAFAVPLAGRALGG